MKRSIFLSIILSLFLVACIPQAMAQKQSRLEKLLRYLNDNDADKWQKNRDKLIFPISVKKRKYNFPTYKTKRNWLLSPFWKLRKIKSLLARR